MIIYFYMGKLLDKNRPISWSNISLFEYDKNLWYKKYVLGEEQPTNKEMKFGKMIADSMQTDSPIVPFVKYSNVEFELKGKFGDIPLIGFIDTYEPHKKLREYKTGKRLWDQKRADTHKQIDMYLFMIFLLYGVKPEDIEIYLDWAETVENGDFTISLKEPVEIKSFKIEKTTDDILKFGVYLNKIYKEMLSTVIY